MTETEERNVTSEAKVTVNSVEMNDVTEDELISKEEFDACVKEKEQELAMARLQLEQDIRVHQAVLQLEVSKATEKYTTEIKKVDGIIEEALKKANILKSSEETFCGIIQTHEAENMSLRSTIEAREQHINDLLFVSQGGSLEEAFNSQIQTVRSKLEGCHARMLAKDEEFSSFLEEQNNIVTKLEEMHCTKEEKLKEIREHLCSLLKHFGHEKMSAQNKKNEAEYKKSLLKSKIQLLKQRNSLLQKLADKEVTVEDLHDQLTEYESIMEMLLLSNKEIQKGLSS